MFFIINVIFNEFLNDFVIKIKHNIFLKFNNDNMFWNSNNKVREALSGERKGKFLTLKKEINYNLNELNDNVF